MREVVRMARAILVERGKPLSEDNSAAAAIVGTEHGMAEEHQHHAACGHDGSGAPSGFRSAGRGHE